MYACRVGWGASQRVLRPQLLRLIESQIPELRAPHLNPRFNPVRHPPPPPTHVLANRRRIRSAVSLGGEPDRSESAHHHQPAWLMGALVRRRWQEGP